MSDVYCHCTMDSREEYRSRMTNGIQRMGNLLLRIGRRQAQFISEYRYLIAVMLIGFIIWTVVFNIALVDYLNSSRWNTRAAWMGPLPGPADFDFFGYTIPYQLEGYSDYSFYYVHWGHNVLNGVLPYSPEFGYLLMDGTVNENGLYIFPPLTAYLYGAGIWLETIIGPGNWGIGLLLASFGYLTALPVYGIAKELSKNPRVGEIAALTYLLNPLVLYHIDYLWLNPSAFYFFFFAGFYALLKKKKHIGTILIVTAALFKQTAWFLGIPLVIFLIMRSREPQEAIPNKDDSYESDSIPEIEDVSVDDASKSNRFSFMTDYFDFRSFAVSVVVALSFAGVVMLPTLIAEPHFWDYWRLAMGYFSFDGNYVDVPSYGVPMTLPVIPIVAGMPDLAALLDSLLITSVPLIFGVVVITGVMVLLDKREGKEHIFLRQILFLTMLLMLWVSLTGPRGVFKYYFVMFGPFFSIFASGRMICSKDDHVPVSLSMFLMPFAFTLLILIPERNTYLLYVVLIFILYILSPLINRLYDLVKRPFRFMKNLASRRKIKLELHPTEVKYDSPTPRRLQVLEYIILITSAIIGGSLLLYGVIICFSSVSAAISVILQFFIVAGVMIFIGAQILSIAVNGLLSIEERRSDLNDTLKTLSFSIVAVVLIFGLITYALSWNIESVVESQALVVSSTVMAIWAFSLVVKLKKHIRLLAGLLLLSGASLATWTWLLLNDAVMYNFGLACIAGLILYILFLLVEFLVPSENDDGPDVSQMEIETLAQ
ncbi:MAG: hypothetical protein ACTSYJ_08730 [Candidatus Thorarchaeota archaeon]